MHKFKANITNGDEKIKFLEVGTKAQSKNELYRILTVEGGMHLPPDNEETMDFISDIAFTSKRQCFEFLYYAHHGL